MVARFRHDEDASLPPAPARRTLTRRSLFRRSLSPDCGGEPIRPPWALAESAFLERCSRCTRCIDACEEGVLTLVRGYPEADFRNAECTFCGACADACRDGALDARALAAGAVPWTLQPEIAGTCLADQGVHCGVCGDVCDARALRFTPRVGGAPQPEVAAERCTGCGACVAACPSKSISLTPGAPAD